MAEYRNVAIGLLEENKGQIEGLPANPRQWTRMDLDSLKKSIEETPELLEARGCIAVPHEGRFVVLGGNMRLSACRELGMKEIPCYVFPESTPTAKLMELDPHYCDVIIARWEKMTGKKAERITE